MKGAQILVEMLIQYETEVVFGLPGDTTVGFYDALHKASGRITHIMARDERSAGFMADVYARLTGKPGVCEGPSGGGATYLLPGIVEAHGSSVAMVALTTDNPLSYEAQGALTDLDQPRIFESVTKWTALVKRTDMLPRFIRRAFRLATSGRPGAVHLALPKDVLAQEMIVCSDLYAEDACKTWPSYRTRTEPGHVGHVVELLMAAERPVIVAGGGAVSSGAHRELNTLSRLLVAPVATTINGKGAIAETEPLALGVIGGNGGRPYAAEVVRGADLILFVGSKVNYVDTDHWRLPALDAPPTIVQIDIDPAELGNNYPIDEGLCGDARRVVADIVEALKSVSSLEPDREEWLSHITKMRAAWRRQVMEAANRLEDPIQPQRVVRKLWEVLPDQALFICDPGTPTPFMAAEFELRQPGRRVISPRAQGGLGYAIPGVVGARLAKPEAPVVGLCGDGSFAMSAGDLATITRLGGPTILVLFNNRCYGWIKALQKLYHEERYLSVDFDEPLQYTKIAQGFGLHVLQVDGPEGIEPALRKALDHGGPCFIELTTAPEHKVIPPVSAWQRAAKEGACVEA
jgi:acetolactate synthase-1/2/3 large subunit